MKTGYVIALTAGVGATAWGVSRLGQRAKLKKLLEESPHVRLFVEKYEDPAGQIKMLLEEVSLVNTISAKDAYVGILQTLPLPEGEEEGIPFEERDFPTVPFTPEGEGRVPDFIPFVGTKEKVSWWKEKLGM